MQIRWLRSDLFFFQASGLFFSPTGYNLELTLARRSEDLKTLEELNRKWSEESVIRGSESVPGKDPVSQLFIHSFVCLSAEMHLPPCGDVWLMEFV